MAPNQSTSKNIVNLMKQIFSEHGIPKIIRSDNGPHYCGQPFKPFALIMDLHPKQVHQIIHAATALLRVKLK